MGQQKALTFSMISNDTLNYNMIKIGQLLSLEQKLNIDDNYNINNNTFTSKGNCFSLYFASEKNSHKVLGKIKKCILSSDREKGEFRIWPSK